MLAYEDSQGAAWLPYLQNELVAYAEITPAYDELAMAALRLDAGKPFVQPQTWQGASLAPEPIEQSPPARGRIRLLLALLALVLAITLLLGDQLRIRTRDMIEVGGGTYSVRNVDGTERAVALDPYVIDRFEVTVADYRRCYAAGGCVWPRETASATRPDYLTNRTYDRYPMINVDWAAATAYCEWAGLRLPSEDEWQVAASYAPATARAYRYPWGDSFQPQVTNSLEGERGDTTVVGSYQPSGSSPMGMADAAGNVAEWTATTAAGDPSSYRTKGGSFADSATYLQPQAVQSLPSANHHEWLGFRCAASPQ
jgi:iron(II)-dependent oxidoreductase